MDNKELLLEIRSDVKEIRREISDIKVLDAVQNTQLAEHMRRTETNEHRIKELEDSSRNLKWLFGGLAAISTIIIEIFRRII